MQYVVSNQSKYISIYLEQTNQSYTDIIWYETLHVDTLWVYHTQYIVVRNEAEGPPCVFEITHMCYLWWSNSSYPGTVLPTFQLSLYTQSMYRTQFCNLSSLSYWCVTVCIKYSQDVFRCKVPNDPAWYFGHTIWRCIHKYLW